MYTATAGRLARSLSPHEGEGYEERSVDRKSLRAGKKYLKDVIRSGSIVIYMNILCMQMALIKSI